MEKPELKQKRYTLPKGWVWAAVGEIAEVTTGNTPSKADKSNYGNFLPWVKPPQLDSEKPIIDTPEKLSKKGAKLARILPKDSILISCIGLLGKVGIAGCELATNQQINSLTFKNMIFPKYAYFYCKSQYFKDWLQSFASATTVPILNKGRFSEAPIPIAPKNEQKRIIQKIESLLDRLNKTKQELTKIPSLLKKFRQSVLVKAFSGELTKEWRGQQRDSEPASKLLERIREERKKKLGKKYKEPEPIDTSNLPELPEGWEYTRIKDIGEVVTGSTPKTQVSKYWGGDIVWLTPKDLGKNSSKYIADSQRKITKKGYESCSTKLVPKDSIVISTRAPIGHIAIVKVDFCTNQGCKSLLPHKGIFSDYLYYLLVHNKEILQGLGSGTTFSELSKDKLEDFVVPLPSSVEQKYIVRMIESFFTQADTIEKSVKIAQAHCEKLTQSILAKAFRGELVEQDPNDEPAEELLKRGNKITKFNKTSKKD
jgi:type I restriction enzyme S subunit